jgi:2-isopropylmalate synthase
MSHPYFHIHDYSVRTKKSEGGASEAEACIDMRVGLNRVRHTASGVGPVHALERALRMCLSDTYPEVASVRLCDYSVAVVDAELATAARVRVIIRATDGTSSWDAGAVSQNVIEASFEALCSATVMGILRARSGAKQPA